MEKQLVKEFDNEFFKADYNEFKDEVRTSLHKLLNRKSDIIIKVINGKTEERLASELIGEMYMQLKDLKEKTTDASVKRLKEKIKDSVNVFTLIILIITLIKVWFK